MEQLCSLKFFFAKERSNFLFTACQLNNDSEKEDEKKIEPLLCKFLLALIFTCFRKSREREIQLFAVMYVGKQGPTQPLRSSLLKKRKCTLLLTKEGTNAAGMVGRRQLLIAK